MTQISTINKIYTVLIVFCKVAVEIRKTKDGWVWLGEEIINYTQKTGSNMKLLVTSWILVQIDLYQTWPDHRAEEGTSEGEVTGNAGGGLVVTMLLVWSMTTDFPSPRQRGGRGGHTKNLCEACECDRWKEKPSYTFLEHSGRGRCWLASLALEKDEIG